MLGAMHAVDFPEDGRMISSYPFSNLSRAERHSRRWSAGHALSLRQLMMSRQWHCACTKSVTVSLNERVLDALKTAQARLTMFFLSEPVMRLMTALM
jgi:hypothetical protein